jgi:ATP-dependent RNA helicase RhlE
MTFDELNLAPAIAQAVRELGYTTPTPIQAQAIPLALAGHDLLAGAQTGTGKTAAFALPILQKLSLGERSKNRWGGVGARALVLTPTRELAAQVQESMQDYGKHLPLRSTVIFGGVGMGAQVQALRKGVDIVVATPGRLLDLMQQGLADLNTVEFFVLDEADRMLDMGFIHDVKKVLAVLPKQKQSLLFSATFSDTIRELATGLLKNPKQVQVTPSNTTVQRITQVVHPVGRDKKTALLIHLLREKNWTQVLVFTRTKFGANEVASALNDADISAMALHGNKSQSARTQALGGFKTGQLRVLVATDIAARGIDIDDLPHVINYDIPNVSEDYVHRIGRTGRAGQSGEAISFVSVDEEGFMREIERFSKQSIPKANVPGFEPAGETAMPIAMGRQTLWGGIGKPPSREVLAAAAKTARREMLARMGERNTGSRAGARAGSKPSTGGRNPTAKPQLINPQHKAPQPARGDGMNPTPRNPARNPSRSANKPSTTSNPARPSGGARPPAGKPSGNRSGGGARTSNTRAGGTQNNSGSWGTVR